MTGGPAGRRIVSVAISHFRSYRQASLSFGPGVVAVFGPNGAGKTNLLEALSMLSPGRGLRRADPGEIALAPDRIGWKVAATVEGPGGAAEAVVLADAEGRKQVALDGKAATQAALGAVAPMLWLTPAIDGLWTGAAEERRRFLDRATLAFVPGHAAEAAAYDKAMRERNRLLRDGPRDARWLDALEARMAASGTAVARARVETARRLAAAQSGARSAFPRADIGIAGWLEERVAAAEGAGAEATVAQAFAEALARGRRADEAAGRALLGPHRADLAARYAAKDVDARLCSTGEQKALVISLTLASARALAAETGAPPVLLLDEIAAHLDAGRREALYEEVLALGAQAFLTGAGAELFDALGDRAMRLRVTEGPDGASLAAPL